MNNSDSINKYKRRKKITLISSVVVLASYITTQAVSLAAKMLGLSSITYGEIGMLILLSVGGTIVFMVIIYFNKTMNTRFVNGIYFAQFLNWLFLYTIWVSLLREGRVVGLFFALVALCFLLSNANRLASLAISIAVCILHSISAYWGITQMEHGGSLSQEMFYIFCFLPAALLISYLAGLFDRQKKEIKAFKRSAEETRDSLQDMIQYIAEKCKILSAASEELLEFSTNMNNSSDGITFRTKNTESATNEMSEKTNSVARAINEAATNVNLIAASTEEISATILEILQNSEKAKNISDQAVKQSRSVSEKVKQLGKAAQEVGKITEVISDISEQTNLLALNATIEAARAGESGKGFAVVANEIKELARQTAAATHQIKQQIQDIQGVTSESVSEIIQNVEIINKIDEIVSTITTSIEEQSKNTEEIARNVSQSSRGIIEVKENAVHVSTVAAEIAKSITDVNQDVSTISSNSSRVNQSAKNLSELARSLREMTDENGS